MLLNNQKVNNEVKVSMRRHLAMNENETTTIQHLWDTGKAIRGKFIELQAYLKQNKTTRIHPQTQKHK